jgi:hypothetical protein
MKSFGNIAKDGQVRAVASGTLPNGKAVIVNSNGTVSAAASTGTAGASGTKVAFDGSPLEGLVSNYDPDQNKVVMFYSDNGNSKYGTAVVGTVDNSDNSITFGTPVVYSSASTEKMGCTYDTNSNKHVVGYKLAAGFKSKVGTVSGTSISFGSEATISNVGTSHPMSMCFDNNSNKVVASYSDAADGDKGKSAVGTVSGTSISYGSPVTWWASTVNNHQSCFDSNENCVLVFFQKSGNDGYVAVGDVSGTSITYTTAASIGNLAERPFCEFHSGSNKVILAYMDRDDGESAAARTVTIGGSSGSRTTSFGSEVNFASGASNNCPIRGIVYDPDANKILISYLEESGGNIRMGIGTVSGTDLTFKDPNQLLVSENAGAIFIPLVYDTSSDRVIAAYDDTQNSDAATAIVVTVDTLGTNITSENFIGFSDGAFATTQSAAINTANTIDRNQSGLTAGQTYFVQTDGTIGTTAADPSVTAGTAISATELIVKG